MFFGSFKRVTGVGIYARIVYGYSVLLQQVMRLKFERRAPRNEPPSIRGEHGEVRVDSSSLL